MQVGEKKETVRFSVHPLLTNQPRLLGDNVTPLRHVQTVKELRMLLARSHTQPGYYIALTFRISLFRTLQTCWRSAALWDTSSREFPESWSSSLTLGEG